MPFKNGRIDTLVLGCTHYPLLSGVIAEILPGVTQINSGAAAARRGEGQRHGEDVAPPLDKEIARRGRLCHHVHAE